MEFIVGIIGNLISDLISSGSSFLFQDLTDNIQWKKWKQEHHLSKNQNDFLDRYAETLIILKKGGKPNELLGFFGEGSVINVFHDYWYGNIDESSFDRKLYSLVEWFTLDQRLEKFSAKQEVVYFFKCFGEAVNQNRTAGEREMFQKIVEIWDEIKKESNVIVPKFLTRIPFIDLEKELIGRETDIQRLEKELENTSKIVLMNGLGGIGKTVLAAAYLQLFNDKYDHLVWINRGDDLIDAVALNEDLIDTLNIPIEEGDFSTTRFRRILRKLQQLPGRNLLVIDNVQQQVAQKEIYEQLPGIPNWQVLVTSRFIIEGFNLFHLKTLSSDDARQLFQTYYKGQSTEEEIEELMVEVDYHTLTIELLAKLLDKLNNILSVSELTKILKQKELNDPDLQEMIWTRHSGEEYGIYLHLMKAFELSSLEEAEKHLLKQFVVLPVEQYAVSRLAKILDEKDLSLNRTLNSLTTKGWLTRHEDKSFSIHRLIRQVVDYQLRPVLMDVEPLVMFINTKIEFDSQSNPITKKFPWIPYGESISDYFNEIDGELLTDLRSNIGEASHSFGLLEKAMKYHQRALKSRIKILGETHPDTAASYNLIGSVLRDFGNWDEAMEMHEKGLVVLENSPQAKDQDYASTYNYIAMVFHDKGNVEEALSYYKKSYSIKEKSLDETDPELAILKSNIAQVHREIGQLSVALGLHLEALEILNSQPNINPLSLANSYNNIGLIYRDLKNIEIALKYHKDTVSIREANLPSHHLDLASAFNNLGLVYEDKEDYENALKYYLKVLPILEPLNPNHPNLAQCYSNIAGLYQKMGDNGLALKNSQKALEIREFIFKDLPLHPAFAQSYNNIGSIYRALKEYDNSIKYFYKSIEVLESIPHANQFNLATSYGNLGRAYFDTGQNNLALKAFQQAISIREKIMDSKDVRLARHYEDIANVYEALKNKEMTTYFLKKASIIREDDLN